MKENISKILDYKMKKKLDRNINDILTVILMH